MMLFVSALTGCLLFVTVLWVVGERIKNASVIDAVWSLMIAAPAVFYILAVSSLENRHVMALVMVVAWALRLSLHIAKRLVHEKKEDKRYTQLREKWGDQHSFRMLRFFWIQGATATFFSLPFLLIAFNDSVQIHPFEKLGFALWVVAFVGEAVADHQLSAFKANKNNAGQTCRVGLWNLSRHPNYFCEWLIWVSFFVFTFGSPYGILTLIFPVAMLHILRKVTGVPLNEKQTMSSRGESYRKYIEEVNAFFPGWSKRSSK